MATIELEHAGGPWRETSAAQQRGLQQIVDAHPLAAAGVAVAVGFALGGGVTRSVLTLLLGAAVRAAGVRIGDALLERERERGPAPPKETP